MPEKLSSFLASFHVGTAPDAAPALKDDASSTWLTYGELRSEVRRLAGSLETETKSLIFCVVASTIPGVIAYLAAADSGHAVAMIDAKNPDIARLIESYEPLWIVSTSGISADGYLHVASVSEGVNIKRRKKTAGWPVHDDLFLLLLTSGSAGSPKSVRLSYENVSSNTKAIVASLGLNKETRALVHLPLAYSFGLSVLHMQLDCGASCVLTEYSMMDRDFWTRVREGRVTLFPGVPYHFDMLLKLGLDRLHVPKIRTFIQAGGKLRAESLETLLLQTHDREGEFYVMYGQTEASPRMASLALHKTPHKIGSCGTALPGGRLRIVEGEIYYTGRNVMLGYAENASDLQKGDEMHGELATGDYGSIDGDGFLTILGRKSSFTKIFGNRVSLTSLEECVAIIAPTVAVPGENKIILYVEAKGSSQLNEIKELITQATSIPLAWLDIRALALLPRSASGKIDHDKLRTVS